MSATVHAFARPAAARPMPMTRLPHASIPPLANDDGWLVDVAALARCRDLFSGHAPTPVRAQDSAQARLEVPAAYAQFCRNHFAAVQRLYPQLEWSEACHAYAVALSAHACLCDGLDDQFEALLATHWPSLRGDTSLDWTQARGLVADGCSALARLDPLSMNR